MMMPDDRIPNRSDWLFGCGATNILDDKNLLRQSYIRYMLGNTIEMFAYKDLPDSIPQKELEILHQVNSFAIWKKVEDKLYVFHGGLGGVLNEYYHPTEAIVSNPYLNYNANLKIDEDCVVTFNDKMRYGLLPLFNRYASLLAEVDISLRFVTINTRIPYLVNANDDDTKESVDKVFKDIWDGKFGIALNKRIMDKDSVFTSEFGARNEHNIKDLIELRQFLKSSWYMELGIQSNYNMKRESLNSNETTMDESVLLPLIDDMLNERKIGLEKVNKMFGTNITVELSSSWKKIREEIKNELAMQQAQTNVEKSQEEQKVDEKTDVKDNEDEKETNRDSDTK